jgi:hypothetical protein
MANTRNTWVDVLINLVPLAVVIVYILVLFHSNGTINDSNPDKNHDKMSQSEENS